ncbi:MAG TPA: DNA polymerase III subunit gamma/tau [Acidobacteriaceae bacterium]|nr:DNA polymerase III subunit gamma/tau [Acidobacteriaceae bacterium]
MAYQVLARKYRPQRFSDVIGQDHVTRTLLNALSQNRVAHGYIFSGHRGIGKTTIARILAMALNCRTEIGAPERPTPEPCSICDSCIEIRAGNAVDVIEIDAATNRGIDEIRELRDAARYRPARDRFKIYILDEAHQITDAAFNALLKTLEEPPDHIVFMMATTQPEDIPQTIRSRCQHFSFHAVRFDDILAQLRDIAAKESIIAEDAALAQLAEAGDGSMRDALSIMDQAIASAPQESGRPRLDAEQVRELMGTVPNTVFERLMEAISESHTADVIEEINGLLNAGNSPSQLARQFVHYLRNALMARIDGENSELLQISPDERARAARSAALFSEEDLTRFLQIMLRTFNELNYRQEQRFHLELGLIKLVHLGRLLPVEEFLSKLPVSASGKTPAAPRPQTPASRPSPPSHPARQTAPAEPQKPAFSPFEADRSRKITGETAAPSPRALTPLEAASHAAECAQVKAPSTPAPSTVPETTSGSLALAPEPSPDTSPKASPDIDLEQIRDAITAALDSGAHNTAAALLGSSKWTSKGAGSIEVEVPTRKTMLSLTINGEAEKICRDTLRSLGIQHKLRFLPGEGVTSEENTASPKLALGGSVQAQALEHPLVKQAQELFHAEVRSVLDLRGKK